MVNSLAKGKTRLTDFRNQDPLTLENGQENARTTTKTTTTTTTTTTRTTTTTTTYGHFFAAVGREGLLVLQQDAKVRLPRHQRHLVALQLVARPVTQRHFFICVRQPKSKQTHKNTSITSIHRILMLSKKKACRTGGAGLASHP